MDVVIFGVSEGSSGVEYDCALYGFNIIAYIDNDRSKWKSFREGVPVLPPSAINDLVFDKVFTASDAFHEEMKLQLLSLGVDEERIFRLGGRHRQWPTGARYLISRIASMSDELKEGVSYNIEKYEITGAYYTDNRSSTDEFLHRNLVAQLWEALILAENDLADVAEPYRVGDNWYNFIKHTRPNYCEAVESRDIEKLEELLKNFCRNELSTGILGGQEAFENYCLDPGMVPAIRHIFNIWAYSIGKTPVEELASPMIGNPYGHLVNGSIVHPNTFLNHYRGVFSKKLIGDLTRPVIAEIGGGYGGFGYYVLKFMPGCCYLNFDLPANLIISSYYLSLSYPDLRIAIYSGRTSLGKMIQNYDVILMPHFMIDELPDLSIDLFVNTISLSEMNYSTICEYLSQVSRVSKLYFYHENLINNRSNYEFYPIDTFPSLPEFKEIYRVPSRWPFFSANSPEHCHMEQLFVKNN